MLKNGLILEGGAMRSVFTAGILDFFMDESFLFDEVYTTSAGAYATINYLSGQRGRCIETNIKTLESGESYVGVKTFFKTLGNFFDMDKLFNEYPNVRFPFDYESFFGSKIKLTMSVTDCKTGSAVYYDRFGDNERLMKILRASNSLPFISRLVKIDGGDMVDGGMADPIPVYKAISNGVKKPVVVLTQNREYRKKLTSKYGTLIRSVYWKYPKFRALLKDRPARYNEVLDFLEREEEAGNIFVIRPELPSIKNYEKNTEKLMEFYHHGYNLMKSRFEELKEFLDRQM